MDYDLSHRNNIIGSSISASTSNDYDDAFQEQATPHGQYYYSIIIMILNIIAIIRRDSGLYSKRRWISSSNSGNGISNTDNDITAVSDSILVA